MNSQQPEKNRKAAPTIDITIDSQPMPMPPPAPPSSKKMLTFRVFAYCSPTVEQVVGNPELLMKRPTDADFVPLMSTSPDPANAHHYLGESNYIYDPDVGTIIFRAKVWAQAVPYETNGEKTYPTKALCEK